MHHPLHRDYHWTLAESLTFQGIGLHSGEMATVELHPTSRPGIWWGSTKAYGLLDVAQVSATSYCTTLSWGNNRLQTVEHLLSALYGCGLSAVEILVHGSEIPIGDGSALFWCQLFQQAGYHQLPLPRTRWQPSEPVHLDGPEQSWIDVVPAPHLALSAQIHYDQPRLIAQEYHYRWSPDTYPLEIAPARTFGFSHQLPALQAAGLIRGASLANALLVNAEGYANPPRFEDELVRHKVLDLLGDLALLGSEPQVQITACRAGHALHVKMVEWLNLQYKEYRATHG